MRREHHRRRAADDRAERRHHRQHVVETAGTRVVVSSRIALLLADRGAERLRKTIDRAPAQRRDGDVRRQHEQREDERGPRWQRAQDEECSEERREEGDRPAQDETVHADPHASGDQGGQAEQGGDVEDVGADHDADARALVAGDDRCHGRRDFRRVGAERRHHSEQRFGEAEALADAVEFAREHEAGGDREDEPADEKKSREWYRHGRSLWQTSSTCLRQ